jgi:hypothetical protein
MVHEQLAEFNKIIFKKDVSPLKKWAIVEGLTTYLALRDHMTMMSTLPSINIPLHTLSVIPLIPPRTG